LHSLTSQFPWFTDIFIRELISNASDAIDKARFLGITDKSILADSSHFNITIQADKANRKLIITDSGIGMTQDDLVKNLGTIAKSGTSDFLNAMEKSKDATNLIGQFGVGFYSVYLVADNVQVISKHPKSKDQYIWESNAESKFVVSKDPKGNTLPRGTQIILSLKEEASQYLEEPTLTKLIEKYSGFIEFPIFLHVTKTVEEEVPIEEEKEEAEGKDKDAKDVTESKDSDKKDESDKVVKKEDETKSDEDDELVIKDENEKEEEAEKKPKTKKVSKEVQEWKQMNTKKPVWTRSPSEISDTEYNEFYQSYFKDWQDPISHAHFKGEGGSEFKALMYIPDKPSTSVLQLTADSGLRNIKLFVRKVFITDELIDFLPRYLSFVKGIIDSDDFQLNVSRETIQQSRLMRQIKSKVIQKVLGMWKQLAANETQYEKVYPVYSGYLKLGIMEDKSNQKKLAKLLRYPSTFSKDNVTDLDSYLGRMRKNQKAIYYLTGNDVDQMRKSPYLEALTKRGYEVLLMHDGLDEYVTQSMPEYSKVKLQNIVKGKLEFGDEDDATKNEEKELADKYQPLTTWFSEVFKDHVDTCLVSNRLTTSPLALIAKEHAWSGTMESMMKLQKDSNSQQAMMYNYYASQKKTLEINPQHPVITALLSKVEDGKAGDDEKELAFALLDMAFVKGDYPIPDKSAFARRIENAIRVALSVDLSAQAKVDVKAAPEVEPVKPEEVPETSDLDEEAPHDEL
jgi:heat shock protein beta